jgi:hypothetical protein
MNRATYYRKKDKLKATTQKRLYEVAQKGFVLQHMQRIDQLEHIETEMWENYLALKGKGEAYKACLVLEKIANIQPLLSSYYEATKEVMEKGVQEGAASIDISNIRGKEEEPAE